jgi:hypothetical protein
MFVPNVYTNEYNSINENKATAYEASTNTEISSIESAPPNFFYEKGDVFR